MKYTLEELIDIPLFQILQDKLNAIYPFPCAIIDNDGKILTATAWQPICTRFHRVNPLTEKECIASDQYIIGHINEANPSISYTCPHGLVDNAIPIIINGDHLGNFFTGQFFHQPPDLEFFTKQAAKYGFDEDSYLDAVRQTPVWSQDHLKKYLEFILPFVNALAEMGMTRLGEIEQRKAITKSENRFHNLVETAHDLIWQCDRKGRFIYLNPAWESMLGYKNGEILGKRFIDFQTPLHTNKENKEFKQLILGNAIKGWEINLNTKDGKQISLVINGKQLLDSDGKPTGMQGTAHDITDRKLSEEKLAASENRFRSLFESTNEMVVLHELIYDHNNQVINYRVIDCNPVFTTVTGIQHDDAVGILATDLYGTDPAPYLDIYSKVALTAIPTQFETYFQPMDKHFHISVSCPSVGQFATITSDITDRKQIEVELQKLNAALEERVDERTAKLQIANKDLESFTYSVSHDLRAPLRAISGFSEIISSRYRTALDEEGQHYLDNIIRASTWMARLIEDLLNYSRLGRKSVHHDLVSLGDILLEQVDDFNNSLIESGGSLTIADDLPSIISDRTLLNQIFYNLIGNAIKYNKSGDQPNVKVSCQINQNDVIVSVSDQGIGIPLEYQEKIFNIFQRLHSIDEYPGTGIGLAIVQRASDLLGGSVWVESEINKGSTFFVKLPKE